jgi:group II intron reverse transcriptase/maturase
VNATVKGNKDGTPIPETLSTRLNRVSETAKRNPQYQFENIAHLMNVEMLAWAHRELRKDSAAGVDGVTAEDYEKDLQNNLADLHNRLKEGRYRAQPLRRTYIEKEDGKLRPLSIPGHEDKVCQKAATDLLSRIFENDFLPTSYGYRPGKSPHDALDAIQHDIIFGHVNYVLDADISDYFGSIVRSNLMEMLQKRVTDKHLLALIGKWLQVGVIDEGKLFLSENGTYQGSVISPVLANVYLHEVLDLWVENEVKPRLLGPIKLYRFADDFVATFIYQEDAQRFLQVLSKRFEKFGLKLHPEKTRLIKFGRHKWEKSKRSGNKPETFNFLGFTHYCGTTLNGKFSVKVKTMAKRQRRGLARVMKWCEENRHRLLDEQHQHLRTVLYGHYAYYGRRNNFLSLRKFYRSVERIWQKWLSRRGGGHVSWYKLRKILSKYPLPKPRIVQGLLKPRSQLNWFEEFI